MTLPYVYKLTHRETGEFYIGYRQSNILPAEEDLPLYQSSSRLVKEMGFDNFDFEIVSEFSSGDEAYIFEQRSIKKHIKDPLCLNRHYINVDNGSNHFVRKGPLREESLKKMIESRKGQLLTEEHKRKIGESRRGIKDKPESIKRKSDAKLGNTNGLGVKRALVECPHCHKTGGINAMKKWHFDRCKHKT